MKKLLTVVVLITFGTSFAQVILKDSVKSSANRSSIYANKTNTTIKIDGKLTEKDWEQAQPISDFVQVEPSQGEKPKFKTSVKILYDKKNLYIGAFCAVAMTAKRKVNNTSFKFFIF